MQNSYKKSGVNISLANKLVKHISGLTKNVVKKGKIHLIMKILAHLDQCLISAIQRLRIQL